MQTTHHLHKTILALAIYIFPRKKISLSLLIKMAHNLHVGQKFEDFSAFESAIMRCQNAENVQLYRRDSKSVDKAQPRLENKLNPKIKYYKVIKYHCINGGKKHISKATRAREGRISNCYDFVSPFSVPLNSSALTSLCFTSLHCYMFFGVPHFFQFCFFVSSLVLNKD